MKSKDGKSEREKSQKKEDTGAQNVIHESLRISGFSDCDMIY